MRYCENALALSRAALGAPVWFQAFNLKTDLPGTVCLDVAVLLAELRRVGCCTGPLPSFAPAEELQLGLRSAATAVAAVIMRTDLWIRCVQLVPVPWEDEYGHRLLERLVETWAEGHQLANCRVQVCRSRSIKNAQGRRAATRKARVLVSAVRGVAERIGAAMPSIRAGLWTEAAARLQGPGVAKAYAGTKWARVLLEGLGQFVPRACGGNDADLDAGAEAGRGPVAALAWLTQTPAAGLKDAATMAAMTHEIRRRAEATFGEGTISPSLLGAQLCAWTGAKFAATPRGMHKEMMYTFTCPAPDAARALLAAQPAALARSLILSPGPLDQLLRPP